MESKAPGREELGHARRIVVKVGTGLLCSQRGKLNLQRMGMLAAEIKGALREHQVLLVSSGAIGAGVGRLGLKSRPRTIPQKQAAAAVGQGVLMQQYEACFAPQVVAQVLLTREDINDRERYLNARHTFLSLINYGVLPIVNENDTVAVDEIRFGDNDTLAALVACLVDADLLILLSDIEGLFTGDPRQDSSARLISEVRQITPEVEALAGGRGSDLATGGMGTKLNAARITMQSGIPLVLANGLKPGTIPGIMAGRETGTLFVPHEDRLQARKRWIAFGSPVQGSVSVDRGAANALVKKGRSLLPSGVIGTCGEYAAGNVISVRDPEGREIAKGIANYSARDVALIKGLKSSEIKGVLGYNDYDEVIHRDNLTVITASGDEAVSGNS